MKNKTFFLPILLYLSPYLLLAQDQLSILIPREDTIATFNIIPRCQDDRIYLISDAYYAGFFTFNNRYGVVDGFSIEGAHLFRHKIDPTLIQHNQIISPLSAYAHTSGLLVASDQTYDFGNDPQSSILWGLDKNGKKLWSREFNSADGVSLAGSILEGATADEVYHFSTRVDNTNGKEYLDVNYLKVDGTMLWSQSHLLPDWENLDYNYAYTAVKLSDKIVLISDYTPVVAPSSKYMAISINLDGTLIGFTDLSSQPAILPFLTRQLSANSFFLIDIDDIGSTQSICLNGFNESIDSTAQPFCAGSFPLQDLLYISDTKTDQAGNVYVAGEYNFPSNHKLGWLSKWSAQGDLLWQKFYRFSTVFPDGNSSFNGLDFLPNKKGLVLAGTARENAPPAAGKGYDWLLTLDENGCFNGDCGDTVSVTATIVSTLEQSDTATQIAIYPNPCKTQFNLEIKDLTKQEATLQCFDLTGRMVLRQTVLSGTNPIITNQLPSGIYIWQIMDQNSIVGNGRLVKQ